MHILPAQLIDTQAVEFYHSTPDNLVDASISVYETRLAPDEDWQQDPELLFWRSQGAQIDHPSEAVLVNGDAGWLVKSQRSAFLSGDLTRAAFVARNGRLYRFRLRLFQDQSRESDLRIFGLMLGTLQSTPNVGASPKTAPTPSNVTKPLLPRASDPKAVSAGADLLPKLGPRIMRVLRPTIETRSALDETTYPGRHRHDSARSR